MTIVHDAKSGADLGFLEGGTILSRFLCISM